MQTYDLLMLIVLVAATLFGAYKGMAWQVASAASLVVSYLVALNFSLPLAPVFGEKAPWNRFLAMLVLYLGSSAAIWFGFHRVREGIEKVQLKEFDRHVGGALGLLKGALICLVITFFAVILSDAARDAVLRSRSGYYIAAALNKAPAVMPKELNDVLGPYIERLDRELEGGQPRPGEDEDGEPDDNWARGRRRRPRSSFETPESERDEESGSSGIVDGLSRLGDTIDDWQDSFNDSSEEAQRTADEWADQADAADKSLSEWRSRADNVRDRIESFGGAGEEPPQSGSRRTPWRRRGE